MKILPTVSLLTIDGLGNKTQELDSVVNWCCKNFSFASVIRITCGNTTNPNHINLKIPTLNFYEFNRFCVNELYDITKHIDFSHILFVQDDGFIINPNLWQDKFLNYDYIGAPWLKQNPQDLFPWVYLYGMNGAVGNGGFSLRSKALLKECKSIEYKENYPNEDVFICAVANQYLRHKNIKFADTQTACEFSLETKNYLNDDLKNCFGFHGKHLLEEAKKIIENAL